MADRLVLEGMQFFGHHGDGEAERAAGARLDVDVEIVADLSAAGGSDRLADTIDYGRCVEVVRQVVEERRYHLLEAVAEAVAAALLDETRAEGARVRVAKVPPLRGTISRFAVVVERARGGAPGGGGGS